MLKVIRKQTALFLVLTLLATTMATAQTVNMNKYITLTVQQGQQIRLDLRAAAAGTKVKVVSGSTETEVTVDTDWTDFQNYTAGATTMTVYGDITWFDCSNNGTKLTALDVTQNTALIALHCRYNQLTSLDVSRNTALTALNCGSNQLTSLNVSHNAALVLFECYGNRFTTQAFNELMCSLPAHVAANNAKFYPLYNASDAGATDFMAANAQIAIAKNWQVRYGAGSEAEIPPTTGTYTCPVVNMSKYVTLTVQQGQQIRLDLMAAAAGTPVKIVSGSTNQTITVGTSWTGYRNYTAGSTTMTVYGDITEFDCSGNGTKLTALDVSHNTALTELYCYGNQLTSLDVTQNTALEGLYCGDNQITALNVSQNTALAELYCYDNQLTALDVTQNTALTRLWCENNQLTALDVNQNTALTTLGCYDNQLTALDVSHNTALTWLQCYGNNFTTQAFNDLMCSLPARTTADDAKFVPLLNASDAGASAFMAANAQIAKDKNWQVRYGAGGDIPATTGTYVCGTGIAEVASVPLSVYPNPATDILTIETEATGSVITLTDLTGRTVLTATATAGKTTLNVSELSAGTYIVHVGGRVGKVIKK